MIWGSILATPFASPFTTLVSILGGFGGCVLGFLRFSLLAFEFFTLTPFYVAFVLVETTFATKPTGNATPEVILVVHCFSMFSLLLSLELQHATTVMIAVRGMTRTPLSLTALQ